jgi:hypothetical protein
LILHHSMSNGKADAPSPTAMSLYAIDC